MRWASVAAGLSSPSIGALWRLGRTRHASTERNDTPPASSADSANDSSPADVPGNTSSDSATSSDEPASFARLFADSSFASALPRGTLLRGRVVSAKPPFIRVDFGLKREVPFVPAELLGCGQVGDEVVMPLMQMEDDFGEPVMDYSGQYLLPQLAAQRYRLLEPPPPDVQEAERRQGQLRFVFGRILAVKRGGMTVKVLGVETFVPRSHCLLLVPSAEYRSDDEPLVGSYVPLALLSTNFYLEGADAWTTAAAVGANIASAGAKPERSAFGTRRVRVLPVASTYAGYLYILTQMLRHADTLQLSGEERVAYLQLLTRVLWDRSAAVRRFHMSATLPELRRLAGKHLLVESQYYRMREYQPPWRRTPRAPPAAADADGRRPLQVPLSEQRGAAVEQEVSEMRRRRAFRFRSLLESRHREGKK